MTQAIPILVQRQEEEYATAAEEPLLELTSGQKEEEDGIRLGNSFKKRLILVIGSVLIGIVVLATIIGAWSLYKHDTHSTEDSVNEETGRNAQLQNKKDANRPSYHVMPQKGWLNDPNGLIYYNNMYHTFYQYNPNSAAWNWSIHWGHAASEDLVSWTHLPPALSPSQAYADCGGCWSGSMTMSKKQVPTILYTGVVRDNSDCYVPSAQTNWQYNPLDGYRETMMWAQPNLEVNDVMLQNWPNKGILIDSPPQHMRLNGWRDPFVYQRGGEPDTDGDYIVLIGSGLMTKDMSTSLGGVVMAYSSPDLIHGNWTFQGFALQGTAEDAIMWECPWMVEITPSIGNSSHTHVISVGGSLWDETHPLEPQNPVIYWLGSFNEKTFQFEKATEEYRLLDLGETFYAANRMMEGDKRVLIWGWLRECMSASDPHCANHDYAGSLSMPRVLTVNGDTLRQDVPEEMLKLRNTKIWSDAQQLVKPGEFTHLFQGQYYHYELNITLEREDAIASGIILSRFGKSMLITYAWETQQFSVYKDTANNLMAVDPLDPHYGVDNYGGVLQNMENEDSVNFRIFVDGSSVEIFTSSGEVACMRLYFAENVANPNENVLLRTYGGNTILSGGSAWTMNSFWDHSDHKDLKNRALKAFTF
eukprot:TRINITY_DN3769_c0_g1_i6.p1 TRINITY_DN3769_c0_g1~~TRINITY_DN3769_c0_g1_i6.p1  ORF type:complete len:707 (+),score=67.28 TRINITY_DN3769_c0_g1_i6:191-2122(+)